MNTSCSRRARQKGCPIDSPGLVEWLVGLVSLDHQLPDGQAGQAIFFMILLWQTKKSENKKALTQFADRRLLAGIIARSNKNTRNSRKLYFSSYFSKSLEEIYFI